MKGKWILVIAVVLVLAYVFNIFGLKDKISGNRSQAPAADETTA
jgi:hypothetical protein